MHYFSLPVDRSKENDHYICYSFLDIRADWEVFDIVPNDKQILDFVVSFGEAFPLRDAAGNEIVPKPGNEYVITCVG